MSTAVHRIQQSGEPSRTRGESFIFGVLMLSSTYKHTGVSLLFVVASYFVVESFDRWRFQTYNIKPNDMLDHSLFIQMSYLTVSARTMKCLSSI